MTSLLSFILVLGILIFVHELGHFLVAKLFGVRVLKFSLGFGTKLISRKWGDTEYLISAFPLGGYVKMYGDDPGAVVSEADKACSFAHKPVWKRFGIVLAGPVFNLLFAVFLFIGMFFFAGLPTPVDNTVIAKVGADSAAERAGLKGGDIIFSIDFHEVTSWHQVSELIKHSGGDDMELVVYRDDTRLAIVARPVMEQVKNIFGEVVGERYLLGISRSEEVVWEQAGIVEAVRAGFIQTWSLIHLTLLALLKLIQQIIPATELGGPIRIAEIAGQRMDAGFLHFIHFMGLISINLGILNLLPIPVLDGGHLVFMTIEAVRRKPLSERVMIISQQVGIAVLGALMIFVFYNDIARLVQQWMVP